MVHALEWRELSFVTPAGQTVLHPQSGSLAVSKMLAVMGPSGSGKSTFLDVMARRKPKGAAGQVLFNGKEDFSVANESCYVEQEDALLSVLTVRETLNFTARLSSATLRTTSAISQAVEFTLRELGLSEVQHTLIGNVIQRGISGGQKRRVTLGSATITLPRILFLDEVTSGLDSAAAYRVIKSVKDLALQQQIIVIASIHQPQNSLLALFDDLLILSRGQAVYHGPPLKLADFCVNANLPVPANTSPSDHFMELINPDFEKDPENALTRIRMLVKAASEQVEPVTTTEVEKHDHEYASAKEVKTFKRNFGLALLILSQRLLFVYSRNLLAYGIRAGMYLGMALMMALIWLRMENTSSRIQDRLSVLFYSVAFLSFMSVAGIPTFLEERAVYRKESKNGLYGPGPFVLAISIVSLAFLAGCVLLFSVVAYWSMNLRGGAIHFFRFMAFEFLTIYAAESQTILIAALLPNFVASLAVAAFANGFWMSLGGYFNRHLSAFWQKSFHYMDYQTYSFQLLVRNEFAGEVIACSQTSSGCFCGYPSSIQTASVCALTGEDVLDSLGYATFDIGKWAAILISISLIYRICFYLAIKWRT